MGILDTSNGLRGKETQYMVRLECGTFPFYKEELEFLGRIPVKSGGTKKPAKPKVRRGIGSY